MLNQPLFHFLPSLLFWEEPGLDRILELFELLKLSFMLVFPRLLVLLDVFKAISHLLFEMAEFCHIWLVPLGQSLVCLLQLGIQIVKFRLLISFNIQLHIIQSLHDRVHTLLILLGPWASLRYWRLIRLPNGFLWVNILLDFAQKFSEPLSIRVYFRFHSIFATMSLKKLLKGWLFLLRIHNFCFK